MIDGAFHYFNWRDVVYILCVPESCAGAAGGEGGFPYC